MPVCVFSSSLELEGNNRWVKKTIIYFYHFWLKIEEHLIFIPIWKKIKQTNEKLFVDMKKGRENLLLSCGGESLKTMCQCVWSLVQSLKGHDLEFRVSWCFLINQRMKIVIASCIYLVWYRALFSRNFWNMILEEAKNCDISCFISWLLRSLLSIVFTMISLFL